MNEKIFLKAETVIFILFINLIFQKLELTLNAYITHFCVIMKFLRWILLVYLQTISVDGETLISFIYSLDFPLNVRRGGAYIPHEAFIFFSVSASLYIIII